MEISIRTRSNVNTNAVYAMRRSGSTLQQIADKTGRSKERIRQILISNYGSTKHKLMSTEQLRRFLGFSRHHILELYSNGVITPAKEWEANNGQYLLWSTTTISQINSYNNATKVCKQCGAVVPPNRRTYCSTRCYTESHKYKNMTDEAQKRHLDSIRRYRAKQKQTVEKL
ncbi:MAG: hypothetical protein JSU58_05010 [Dehalococcoidales bacterium]|nr:MAG: hypothetical protein JSU58_05010 [Dehalococcoidales bacterium]